MDRRLYRNNLYVTDHDDREATPESGPDSPLSGDDIRMRTAPSHKKSKKGANKRVITVPIGDVDGTKSKGEVYPPSDSWTWRKYGQKPIKGSPYPRGYYRCSSSKGCPARKQVERSRMDPTKIVITYASEHNHSLPTTKHQHHHSNKKNLPPPESPPYVKEEKQEHEQEQEQEQQQQEEQQEEENSKIFELCDHPVLSSEFGWFNQYMGMGPSKFDCFNQYMGMGPSNVLHSNISTSSISTISYNNSQELGMSFSMKEEDESLFADLEELPEYSMVFRQHNAKEPEKQTRSSSSSSNMSAVPCCDTTG